MRPKILNVKETKYPLDYDKNNRSGFRNWRKYITDEVQRSVPPTELMVVQAKKILTREARYKSPEYQKRQVKGDRVVYAILFIAVMVAAIIFSI